MTNNNIVIGSGLSGPLLSILLKKRGYGVTLYEKRTDLRLKKSSSGRSINLALSYRGISALKAADIFDDIKSILIPMRGRMIHHKNERLEFQPYSINKDEFINSVSRKELNKILINKAEDLGIEIYFNYNLKDIDISSKKLKFDNKKQIPIQGKIFGADGSRSQVRKFIDSKATHPSSFVPLNHSYKELNINPSSSGKFQLDPNALHIWPRKNFMLIALPNYDKSFTCTLFLPNYGENSFKKLNTEKVVSEFFKKHFNDVLPLLEDFPNKFFINPTGSLGTIYAKEWHSENNFCLIGDAAHAIVPFFGQGMNASFEDCEILMKCIDELKGDCSSLFSYYNNKRKRDADAIAKMAIENYIEMRDLVLKKKFVKRKDLINQLYKLYPDRFIPRYNMVSFTSIPYSEVYKRSSIQNKMVEELELKKTNLNNLKNRIKNNIELIN